MSIWKAFVSAGFKLENDCAHVISLWLAVKNFNRVCKYLNCSGMMNVEGEQFVTYFVPSKETLKKRMLDAQEDQKYDPDFV